MYKIREAAKLLNVETIDIHKKLISLKKELANHVHKKNGITSIDQEGIDIISLSFAGVKTEKVASKIATEKTNREEVDSENNEDATIQVKMKRNGILTIQIMTLDGSIVKTIERGNKNSGSHLYHWNGKNVAGNSVGRGIYFIRVVGPNIDEIRKVMIIK